MFTIRSKEMIYRAVFKIFLTGCRLFATIKIVALLLVTDLTRNTKNYFFELNV